MQFPLGNVRIFILDDVKDPKAKTFIAKTFV